LVQKKLSALPIKE